MGLTLKQQRFCEELVKDGHQTNAAIRAGVPPGSAAVMATKWLKKVKITDYIATLRAAASEHTGVSLERTLAEIAKLAYIDPSLMYGENGELLKPAQMPAHVRAAIMGIDESEINVAGEKIGTIKKVKLADKNKALDMLMRHHGGYEMDNKQRQPVNLIVDIVDDDADVPLDTENPLPTVEDEYDDED